MKRPIDRRAELTVACAEVDRLRADVALATDTINKCNAWIAEAKPLLERGGKAESELAALRADLERAREDKALLDAFESLRQDDVRVHQISEDEVEQELVGHIWSTISAQTCDVREAIRQSLDAAQSLPSAIRGGEKEA